MQNFGTKDLTEFILGGIITDLEEDELRGQFLESVRYLTSLETTNGYFTDLNGLLIE